MPGRAKRARPGETSVSPEKKRARPVISAHDDAREAREARRAWTDPRDVVVARGKEASFSSKSRRDVVDDFAAAEPSDGRGAGLASSVVAPLRRIARECLLRGDLPRAAAAAALLLAAARASPAGASAAVAAAAAKRRDKGHPDSKRRGEYAAAEREALAIAAECARLPASSARPPISSNRRPETRRDSGEGFKNTLARVASCFAPADEVRARELARESALGGSLDDHTDLIELVASHLTAPTSATRDVERASAESRRKTRAQFHSETSSTDRDKNGVSFARRRAEAFLAFLEASRVSRSFARETTGEHPSVHRNRVTGERRGPLFEPRDKNARAFVRAFVEDARRLLFSAPPFGRREEKKDLSSSDATRARSLEASRLLEKVFAEAPWDFETAAALVFASLRAGNVEEAVRVAAAAASAAPLDADAAALFAELGLALRQKKPARLSEGSSESGSDSSSESGSDSSSESGSDSEGSGSDSEASDGGAVQTKKAPATRAAPSPRARLETRKKSADRSVFSFPANSVPSAATVAAACLAAARLDPGSAEAAAALVAAKDDVEEHDAATSGGAAGTVAGTAAGPAPPTPRDVLECFAARVEATPRAPGAWWALTRALVGFEAGEAEAVLENSETETETETDPAVRALAARGASRRRQPVAPPAAARDLFLNHAPRDSPVDYYALPRHVWWPKSLLARDLIDNAHFGDDETKESLRLLEAQAACAEVLFPEDGFHVLANAKARFVRAKRERAKDADGDEADTENTPDHQNSRLQSLEDWTATWAARSRKRSTGVGRVGGVYARWTLQGKKALGKSFYDSTVRGVRGNDAYHRSRLATNKTIDRSMFCDNSSFRREELSSRDPTEMNDDDDETASLSSDLEGAEAFFRFADDKESAEKREKKARGAVEGADGETSPRARLDVQKNANAVVVSSCSLARRARKDVLRAKRETGPDAARVGAARAEKEKEKEKKKRAVETETEPPRWTKSGARRVSSSSKHSPASARLDRRCKACFYAGVSGKRCGSAKAPTFCFLVYPHERSTG